MDHSHGLKDLLKVVLRLKVSSPSLLSEDDRQPERQESRGAIDSHRPDETDSRLNLSVFVG